MSDSEFESRMEALKAAFGVDFRLDEPEAEDQPRKKATWPANDTWPAKGNDAVGAEVSGQAQLPSEAPLFVPPYDSSKLVVGACLEKDVDFCSWAMVQSYPESFIGKANRPRAKPFFDKILEDRVWDFFYLFNPDQPGKEPRLLVPSFQLEAFLESINRQLGTSLRIPEGINQALFYVKFGKGGTPRPRHLKRTRDEKTLEMTTWPEVLQSDVDAFRWASTAHQADWRSGWKALMPRAHMKDKKKSGEQRAAQRRQDREQVLDKTQRYLHLKGEHAQDVVLVCVDVEAIEVAPHPVSEIGISILDVGRIRGVPPGRCGKEWWQFIDSHHLRVKEYSGLVNYRFVNGCPDDFDFGTSTFPLKADVVAEINAILAPYLDRNRELVIVGHDTDTDIKYLSNIGFEFRNLSNYLGQLDTQTIHQAWKDSDSGRSLESVLSDLFIENKNLHNAGNDAAYTLRALIGVAIEQMREKEAKARGEEYVPGLFDEDTGGVICF